ncbi:hypothetical protein I601_1739 [Nocardioides dokdonensis FR1436]|uniref:Uncharacterized protein n=2 Tax=Nocardioides TaxID=1839 RepID=A0A1A9GKG9_9ACTN|nr:hypothetical protein I601_1739 [Nocardioides dokdonensis FR1436]
MHPDAPLALQSALLTAIEQVLVDAGVERVWIEAGADGALQVFASLPKSFDELDDSRAAALSLLSGLAEAAGLQSLRHVTEVDDVDAAPTGAQEPTGSSD